jgi:hypothetical protein
MYRRRRKDAQKMNRQHVRQLAQQHAILAGNQQILGSVLKRGFFGRLKWLILGR